MNIFELRRLEKAFKEQGATGCTCNETSHQECPDHISTAIEAELRYGNGMTDEAKKLFFNKENK